MRYAYPCDLVSYERQGYGFLVTFPDAPAAITGDQTREESLILAEDALICALGAYIHLGKDIPAPSRLQDGQVLITVPPLQCAKLALYSAMRERGVSKSDLAVALGVSESDVADLLDLDFDSTTPQVGDALKAVKSIKAAERVPA